tara:strand:- start:242 stop:715 length:474 start_codon:yes stop_codon:yes gene_type:complete
LCLFRQFQASLRPLLRPERLAIREDCLYFHNKFCDQVGVEAVSCHNSIVGAAKTIFTLHYLKDIKGYLKKDSPERRIVREARSGAGLDAVIKQSNDAGFVYQCIFDELAQKEDQEAEKNQRVKELLKIPAAVNAVLEVMYENNADKNKQLTVLELMK